jgi:hypothetical protein
MLRMKSARFIGIFAGLSGRARPLIAEARDLGYAQAVRTDSSR